MRCIWVCLRDSFFVIITLFKSEDTVAIYSYVVQIGIISPDL